MGKSTDNQWTMGDLEAYRDGKQKRQTRILIGRVLFVLVVVAIIFLLLALSTDDSDFLQNLLLNLATEAIGAIGIFIIFTLYWEQRYGKLRQETDELRKLDAELRKSLGESSAASIVFAEGRSEFMREHGLGRSDFERPEISDMSPPEALAYLKNLKRS